MDLHARIREAMRHPPERPRVFEECACDLLRAVYPGLSEVSGGHDFGRDADIYFPLNTQDPSVRGRLMATTGDPVANVRGSLARMAEEDLQVDLVVVACLREINARTRRILTRLCDDRGIPEPHIFDGTWFAAQLANNPWWRERLLDVRGDLSALTEQPSQTLMVADLIGRQTEVAQLRTLIATNRDILLTGAAGTGKTRLLASLGGGVTFLEPTATEHLADALRMTRPAAVIVDDAHAYLSDLAALNAARHQLKLSFSIIASTWPSKSDDLHRTLPHAEQIILAPLPRPDIDDIIQHLGITGHRARTVVLDQAEGRPGWAIILASLLIKGENEAVISGTALVDSAFRFVHETAATEIEPDVLACIAAVGYVTAAPLETMASYIGIPLGQLNAVVRRLARNGLLEETRDGWQLLPALRAPLVAHRFFSQRPDRQWSTIQKAFPGREHDFVHVALDVALSTGSPSARNAVEQHIQTLPDVTEWAPATVSLVCEYTRLDERAAAYAVAQARQLLNSPRESTTLHGMVLDSARSHAVELLESAARGWVIPEAVAALLDLALDTPTTHRYASQDPLYTLTDLANRIHPDIGTDLEVRRRLLTGTLGWLSGRRTEQAWIKAAEVLVAVFAVNGRAAWQDPGRPAYATVADRVEPAQHLEELVRLWEQVTELLRSTSNPDGISCPAEALLTLTDLAGSWLRLGEGFAVSSGGTQVTDQQRLAGHRGGRAMIESLRKAVQAVPGVALRANRMLNDIRRRGRSDEPRPVLFTVDATCSIWSGSATRMLTATSKRRCGRRTSRSAASRSGSSIWGRRRAVHEPSPLLATVVMWSSTTPQSCSRT